MKVKPLREPRYEPKILLIDLETTPERGFAFGVREVNLRVDQHSYTLSCAYQWYPKGKIEFVSLPDFPRFKKNHKDDEQLIQFIWKLLDEADIVVAQNGNAFDIKYLNARFASHRMSPPKPFGKVDTLTGLRRAFRLSSNKLDFACDYFGIGRKLPHTGMELWLACMEKKFNPKAWAVMERYNKHDVYLLRELYKLLLPWSRHPNLSLLTGNFSGCPYCQSTHIQSRGLQRTINRIKQRYQCQSCFSWFQDLGELVGSSAVFRSM